MRIAAHMACGSEVTMRRVRTPQGEDGWETAVWCQRCARVVSLAELTLRGSLCVMEAREAEED